MKKILTEAAAVGNAIGRALAFRGRDKWAYYPGSSWQNMLFEGGYSFETPPPQVTPQGIKPYPRTGAFGARPTHVAPMAAKPARCRLRSWCQRNSSSLWTLNHPSRWVTVRDHKRLHLHNFKLPQGFTVP